ncbi:MAG: tRNA uridine-5-carboxymethylaminomethyl(34) synthesis GTPase MnmE [Oscillospiraceae bacterium]|nr:tRNA uridine-5-carboxymethylaminomethyl(34) synthesis GTPase MnmE [Oscillospiraceae bacterium]
MADVIAAISTGTQPCAIGILRLSGDGAAEVAGQAFRLRSGLPLSEAPNRKLVLGVLLDEQGRIIDQALAVYTRAPHTYTGEDTVEIQCHGAPAVLAAGLTALFRAGARQAGPGEFTKRAFLNGQMDLTQAEAVVDLIDAETADAAANAAGQVGGALLRKLDPVYESLTDILSHFGAVLDYPDEEIAPFDLQSYENTLWTASSALETLLQTYDRGRVLKHGAKAVILGKPNVGKSSLLNALAGYDRVIVTEIPGTTRDTVEETVRVGRHLLRLLDTAGIRETDDKIERMGVDRAKAAVRDADLSIFVCDSSQPLTEEDQWAMDAAMDCPHAMALLNKTDLGSMVNASDLYFEYVVPVSAKTGEGLDLLVDVLDMMFPEGTPCDGSILTNARQAGAIVRALDALQAAMVSLRAGLTPDAVLCDVEAAMAALGEVTGRTVREDIVNRIFERFCVGK